MDDRQAASLRAYLAQRGISVPAGGSFTPDQLNELMQMLTRPPAQEDLTATPMFSAAVGVHEFFRILVAAGFTEDQALRYLAYCAQAGSAA